MPFWIFGFIPFCIPASLNVVAAIIVIMVIIIIILGEMGGDGADDADDAEAAEAADDADTASGEFGGQCARMFHWRLASCPYFTCASWRDVSMI